MATNEGHMPAGVQDAAEWAGAMEMYLKAVAEEDAADDHLEKIYEVLRERPEVPSVAELRRIFPFRSDDEILNTLDIEKGWMHVGAEDDHSGAQTSAAPREKIRAACDQVHRYRAERDDLERQLDLQGAQERCHETYLDRSRAEERLMNHPAPHGEALIWKLNRLFGPETIDNESLFPWAAQFAAPFFEDVRRLSRLLDEKGQ